MSAATENLRDHQEQADADGTMVKVSRQAIDETLAEYAALLTACAWAEAALSPFSKSPAEKSGISLLRAAIAAAR